MQDHIRKEFFSIPNLMGYFRLLLVPVYLIAYLNAKTERDYYVAAGIMLVSFLTDFLDGKIARKFHMITEFGKILDPIADKITQGAMALSFAFRYQPVVWLLAVFLFKECSMGIIGAYMLKKGHRMDGAQWYGKICTALLDLVMFLLLLIPDISDGLVNLLVGVGIGAMVITLYAYGRLYLQMWSSMQDEKNG